MLLSLAVTSSADSLLLPTIDIERLCRKSVDSAAQAGFLFAQAQWLPDSATIRMVPGPKCFWGSPLIHGLIRTKASVVLHDFPRSGTVADVRMITTAKENCDLRAYLRTTTIGAPLILCENGVVAQESVTVRLPVTCVEQSGLTGEGALGYESAKESGRLTGSVLLNMLNIVGYGERANVAYRSLGKLTTLSADLEVPWILGSRLWLTASGNLEIEEESYGATHASVGALTEIAYRWRVGLLATGSQVVNASAPADTGVTTTAYGATVTLSRQPEIAGATHRSLAVTLSSSSEAVKADRSYARFKESGVVKLGLPFFDNWGWLTGAGVYSLITAEPDLPKSELFRFGGYRTLRGYPDNTFALRHALSFSQDILFYWGTRRSAFIFVDALTGYTGVFTNISRGRVQGIGYGAGIEVPVGNGSLILAWGRHEAEAPGPGRLHVQFTNGSRGVIAP